MGDGSGAKRLEAKEVASDSAEPFCFGSRAAKEVAAEAASRVAEGCLLRLSAREEAEAAEKVAAAEESAEAAEA